MSYQDVNEITECTNKDPSIPRTTLNVANAESINVLQSKNVVDMYNGGWRFSNVTMTESDGIFRMQSTSSGLARASLQINGLEQGKQYTLSFEAKGVVVSSVGGTTFLRVREGSGSGTWVSNASQAIKVSSEFSQYVVTFTATAVSSPWVWFYLATTANNTNLVDVYFRNVQVEEGDTATDYEPYVAPQEIKAIRDKNNSLIWGRRQYDTKYEGDSWQQTYTGKNLFNTPDDTGTVNGVDYAIQGNIITLNGTCNVSGTKRLDPIATTTLDGTYTTTVIPISGTYTGTNQSNINARHVSDNTLVTGSQCVLVRGATNNPRTWTVTNDSIRFGLYTSNGEKFENCKFKVQVEKGSTSTPYEPYVGGVPAPNPSYPQDIKVVEGPQQVTVYDRNMFDGQMELGIINGRTGQNSSNGSFTRCKNYIPVSENTVYTLSSPTFNGSYNIYEYKSDLTYNMVSNKNTPSGVFTTNAGTAFVRFRPGAQITTAPLDTEYQLEKGSTATAYAPYHGKTYSFNLRGVNIFNKDDMPKDATAQTAVVPIDRGIRVEYSGAETTIARFVTYVLGDVSAYAGNTITVSSKMYVSGDNKARVSLGICKSDGSDRVTKAMLNQDGEISYTPTEADLANRPYAYLYLYANVSNEGTLASNDYAEYTDLQAEIGSTATAYQPYHAPYELAKIGNYKDYIWKDGTDWKLHKAIGNTALLSTAGSYNSGTNWYYESFANIGVPDGVRDAGIISNYFTAADSYNGMQTDKSNGLIATSGTHVVIRNTACTDQATYRTWLAAHEVAVYYVLATATDSLITDAVLIAQLNAMHEWLNRYGYDHTVVGDLPIVINQESL